VTADKLSVLMMDGESDFALFVGRCLSQIPNLQLHILSSDPCAPIRFSRCCHSFHSQSRDDSSEQRLDTIKQAVTRTGAEVILPVDEPAIRFASTHLQSLAALAALPPIPDPITFETITNKWLLAEFLKENHLPGPVTILHTADENEGEYPSFEQSLGELQFPVLIKPTRGRGGERIRHFDNPGELLDFLKSNIGRPSPQYIVQSYIPGYDVDCSVLCKNGKLLAYTMQRGFIAGSQRFAAPAGIDFIRDEQLLDLVSRLVSAIQLNGIAHMDFRCDEREQHFKVIEINARYWGSLIGSLIVDVNFPHLACLSALGASFPVPKYRLGRYVAAGTTLKQWGRKFCGRGEFNLSFQDSGLRYALADPVAEAVKVLR